jgi:hypothetical protein
MPHQLNPAASTPKPVVTVPPAFQAIELDALKDQVGLAVSDTSQDAKLTKALLTAIETLQSDTGVIGAATEFEWTPLVLLRRQPLPIFNTTSIESVTFSVADAPPAAVDVGDYFLDLGKVRPELTRSDLSTNWPEPDLTNPTPWTVTFKAGADAVEDVAPEFTQAGLALAAQLWNPDLSQTALGEIYEALQARQFSSYL